MAERGTERLARSKHRLRDAAVPDGVPRFVGRARERDLIEAVTAAAADRFAALMLVGEQGIGKTALLAHAMCRARVGGFRVLDVRPAPNGVGPPGLALADMLADLSDDELALLPPSQREALDLAACQRAVPESALLSLVVALRLLLRRLALEQQPLMVCIDDLERVDHASARVLGLCLRPLDRVPLGFFGAFASGVTPPAALRWLWAERPERVCELGPLEPGAFAELVRSRCALGLSPAAAHHLWVLCRGNPRAAMDVAQEIRASGPLPRSDRFPVPAMLQRAALARLDELPAGTRRLLRVAAAMHDPTVTVAAAAAGCVPDALVPAVGQGLVRLRGERIRFVEPLVASAAYSDAEPAVLRRLHARLAEVVTDPEERLWQLALGAERPDGRLAGALAGAARRAGRHGQPAWAAELAEAAARLTPANRAVVAARRLSAAAGHHRACGDEPGALRLLERAARMAPPGGARAAALAELAQAVGHAESLKRAVALLKVAHSEADTERLRCVVHRAFAWVHALSGDPAARHHADASLALSTNDPLAKAGALAVRALADIFTGVASEPGLLARAVRLEQSLDAERLACLPVLCRPSLVATLVDVRTGHPERGRAAVHRLERDLVLRGDASALVAVRAVVAELECAAGDWEKAERYATEVIDTAGGATLRPWAFAVRAFVRACHGDAAARNDAMAGAAAARAVGAAPLETQNCAVLALVALRDGEPEVAHEQLGPIIRPEVDDPALAVWVVTDIEALVQLDHLDDAEALLDVFEQRAAELGRDGASLAAARCRGLLLSARGQRPAAVAAVQDALAKHGRAASPFERADTRLVLGQLLRRDNQKLAARSVLADALAGLERLGAAPWAARASRELDSISQTPKRRFTAVEQQVVELALRGHTTREIAARLYVSRRTVESHLSAIYRKVGVRRRVELVSHLLASDA